MKNTRERLIEYLEANPTASPAELGRALHVTAADIRHHLNILSKEGLVARAGAQPMGGRGRPAQRYRLSRTGPAEPLAVLTGALLDEALANTSEEGCEVFLVKIARRLANISAASPSLTLRLLRAVQRLNQLRYQARWEARAGAPQIILEGCPYIAILNDHPELCQLDAALLQELLGETVVQTTRLRPHPGRSTTCVFLVGKRG